MSLAVVTPDDERWLAAWNGWPEHEVHAHPEYVRLYEDDGSRALCALADGVLYPFLLRALPFGAQGADIVTPYGYGGAFRTGPADADAFWAAFDAWAAEEGVVCEVVRFSLFGDRLLPYPGRRERRLVNVVRDLEPAEGELWLDYEHKVRKNVKKALRSGLRVDVDLAAARLEDFLRLYGHTLERRDAADRYHFPRAFFERIRERLPGQFIYAHTLEGGRVVSSELALVSADAAYSFLGGTEEDAFPLRPNDLLKVELFRWAKSAGKRWFVLGGGFRPDDGIFRYKRSFAPRGLMPFEIGMRILRPEAYAELTERAGGPREPGHFPAYR